MGGSRRRARNSLGQFTGRSARRSRVRGYTRSGGIRVSSYLREEDLLNPIGGGLGFMDNPISGGEIATVFVTAGAGWIVTDIISRYFETTSSSYTPSTGQTVLPNAVGILGMPSWWNIITQAGIAVAGLGLGGYLGRRGDGGYGVAALNGLGVGAGLHLIGQLFNALMARWAGSSSSAQGTTPTGTMSRLWSPEIAAQNAQYVALAAAQAATPPGTITPGFAGLPGRLGQAEYAVYNPSNPYGVPTQNGMAMFNPSMPYGQPGPFNPSNPYGVPTQQVQAQAQPMLTQPVASAASAATGLMPGTIAPSGPSQSWPGSPSAGPGPSTDDGCGCMGFRPDTIFPD